MKKLLISLATLMLSTFASAQSNYNFTFQTDFGDGSGSFTYNSGTFTRLSGSGTGIFSGAITNYNISGLTGGGLNYFKFTAGGKVFTIDFLGTNLKTATNSVYGAPAVRYIGTKYNFYDLSGGVSPTGATISTVPEIDGSKVPQALLLAAAAVLLINRRNAKNKTSIHHQGLALTA